MCVPIPNLWVKILIPNVIVLGVGVGMGLWEMMRS